MAIQPVPSAIHYHCTRGILWKVKKNCDGWTLVQSGDGNRS
jgi:hypothetical protein